MAIRTRRLTIGIAVAAAAATAAIALLGRLRFAYDSREVDVAIATSVSLIGLLAAGLVLGRFRRSCRLQDLALVAALVLLTGTNLFFAAVPSLVGETGTQFAGWAPILAGLLAALAFALSVAAPDSTVGRPGHWAAVTILGCLALLGIVALVTAALSPDWPAADPLAVTAEASDSPRIDGYAIVVVLAGVTCALYALAAVGFVGRAERTGDEMMGWFALASPLAAAAQLNYMLFPALYAGWVYTGDIFGLGFYLMLLLGAGREIAAWQQELVEAAAIGERRRIARELHDGLAQELAFIVGQARSLVEQTGESGPFAHISAAAERALDESRTAIAALSRSVDDPLDVALAQAAEDVAGRTGTLVHFDLETGVKVAPDAREDLARIVREAVSNAARHGDAQRVTVALSNTDAIRVRIADDGSGFDPTAPRRRGFGLTSMAERAEARGGTVTISSTPGEGTVVEVVLP